MSADAEPQFVDTNILVYAYDETANRRHQEARQLIDGLWLSGSGCLSVQVLQEFYVTITRKLSIPVDVSIAGQIVRDLSQWKVHAPGSSDVSEAIELHQRSDISLWDALIVHSAARLGCRVLFTEDLNSGQVIDGVRVHNPFTSSD